MTPEERERIAVIVSKIETEKDKAKFIALVQELNRLLDAKEKRLRNPSK